MNKATSSIRKSGNSYGLRIPKELYTDSVFPFTPGETLLVRVRGDKLIVERSKVLGVKRLGGA